MKSCSAIIEKLLVAQLLEIRFYKRGFKRNFHPKWNCFFVPSKYLPFHRVTCQVLRHCQPRVQQRETLRSRSLTFVRSSTTRLLHIFTFIWHLRNASTGKAAARDFRSRLSLVSSILVRVTKHRRFLQISRSLPLPTISRNHRGSAGSTARKLPLEEIRLSVTQQSFLRSR